jgi:hypothetical protein
LSDPTPLKNWILALTDFPEDEAMRISREAIYQALYVESRGVLKSALAACLRTGPCAAGASGAISAAGMGACDT